MCLQGVPGGIFQGNVADLDERLDCAKRDFIALLEEARMLRAALSALVGVSKKEELEKMLGLVPRIGAHPSEAARLAIAIQALLNSPHSEVKDDGTCTGDERKCCGACGDKPYGYDAAPTTEDARVQCGVSEVPV